jgi:hypothetical protein
MSLLTSCFNGVSLQNEVSVLSPRVAFLDQQRTILTVGNSHLKQRIAALAQDKIFKDGQCSTRDSQLTPFLSPFQGFRKHHSREITKHSVFPCSSSRGAQGGDREATAAVPPAADQGHRRCRHRHIRFNAGQARAPRVRGSSDAIARRVVAQSAFCGDFSFSFADSSCRKT